MHETVETSVGDCGLFGRVLLKERTDFLAIQNALTSSSLLELFRPGEAPPPTYSRVDSSTGTRPERRARGFNKGATTRRYPGSPGENSP